MNLLRKAMADVIKCKNNDLHFVSLICLKMRGSRLNYPFCVIQTSFESIQYVYSHAFFPIMNEKMMCNIVTEQNMEQKCEPMRFNVVGGAAS